MCWRGYEEIAEGRKWREQEGQIGTLNAVKWPVGRDRGRRGVTVGKRLSNAVTTTAKLHSLTESLGCVGRRCRYLGAIQGLQTQALEIRFLWNGIPYLGDDW